MKKEMGSDVFTLQPTIMKEENLQSLKKKKKIPKYKPNNKKLLGHL